MTKKIKEGAELEFIYDSSKKCYVVNEKKVKYEEEYSLSALAQKLLDKPYQVAGHIILNIMVKF